MTAVDPPFAALGAAGPVVLERWFARHGAPPLLDLARSGAPALSLRDVLRHADHGAFETLLDTSLDYGDGCGGVALRAAIASSGAARCGEEVLVSHGAVEALLLACAALVGERRRVLVGVPAYEALLRIPAAAGAEVVAIPVWHGGDGVGRLDLDALHDRVDESVAAVLVNSPENPTGAVAAAHDLDGLAARCAAAGAVLIVDEVAVRTLDAQAPHACDLPAFASGAVVTVGDVSKACGLGGLRIGWLTTSSPRLLERVAAAKDLTTVGNAAPSELLAGWALRRREALVGPVRAAALRNLEALQHWIAAMPGDRGASLTAPRDGLVAFPRLPSAATVAAAERIRREHGVALVPGELFGIPNHARVGLGVAPELFSAALDRLDAALRSPAG